MKTKIAAFLAVLLLTSACASTRSVRQSDEQRLWGTQRMLQAHPDVANRLLAVDLIDRGLDEQAQDALRGAARYADKPSQALLAERYWTGEGTRQDKVLGYAWMHLAAERDYPLFRSKRDAYWRNLSEEQRQLAAATVSELASTYADLHAKPRAAEAIDRTRKIVFRGPASAPRHGGSVLIPAADRWQEFSGEFYFNERFWQPDSYFEWTDTLWREAPVGRVDIGEINPVEASGDE